MRRAVVSGGWRTPFVKAGTDFAELDVLDLAKVATAETLARSEMSADQVDEVVYGNVSRPVAYHNLAREIVLSLGLPTSIYASSVGMACASACVAITTAADHIAVGTADVALAGGAESLSNVPLTYTPKLARSMVRASQAKSIPQKLASFADVRPADLAPVAPGIRETSTGLTMGQSAESMAAINAIPREAQDRWALRSHANAAKGWDDGRLKAEVVPVYRDGRAVAEDTHIRRDSTIEKLASLKPVFDRAHGTITAGNASPLTDGAATVLLMSEDRARAEGRTGLVAIRAYAYAAVDPADQLLIAPAYAIPTALKRAGLSLSDIGLVEMHEAFAAQVLSTFYVLEKNGHGRIDEDKVNVMGGSIALGHPFGATGARLVTTLANEMRRRGVQFGLASACAAGGNGAAIVLELLG
ncbi:MAG TPA: acetyl-CoA C-acyltransferase [Candidatus Limnocylindria bacterium]|nr:acetyl-CoA C-acyltransferase [Candidatus Limnocylindria bacterium]